VKEMNRNRILGLDPGTNILGIAVLDQQGDQLQLVHMGIMSLRHLDSHTAKLSEIFLQLQDIIEVYQPGVMAVEAPFFGKNVQSMLKLGRAQGVAMAAAMTMGLEIYDYPPRRIKKAITGNGDASKEQVAAMLQQILKRPLLHDSLDAADALAAAVCYHYQRTDNTASTRKSYKDWKSFIQENPGRSKSK
jgi:crossover junction endodeoxyribonuclease RuvC